MKWLRSLAEQLGLVSSREPTKRKPNVAASRDEEDVLPPEKRVHARKRTYRTRQMRSENDTDYEAK